METFIKEISTFNWWVSVFIVGVFINVISAFISKYAEKGFSFISSSRKQKKEEQAELHRTHVATLKSDNELKAYYAQQETRYRFIALAGIGQAYAHALFGYFIIANHSNIAFVLLFSSTIAGLVGLSAWRNAMKIRMLLHEASPELNRFNV